ncbi:MAG: hypothetical protein N2999_01480 [Proteobacteria bacterium]|nr:hypothetical protein [Pseudomonadota bacterium]
MRRVIIFFVIFFMSSSVGYSQKGKTIDINSNRMEMENNKNLITFIDDVVVKRDDLTLYCSKLYVYYTEDQNKKRDVDYIIAQGNIKIIQGPKTATGDEARFYKDKEIIILTGNPAIVKEGDNVVNGNKITIYLNENKSVIEGNRPRVIFKTGE